MYVSVHTYMLMHAHYDSGASVCEKESQKTFNYRPIFSVRMFITNLRLSTYAKYQLIWNHIL